MKLWLNGRIVAQGEAALDPTDRGLLLGDGLFETLRGDAGRLSDLDAHVARLKAAAAELQIPFPETDIAAAAGEILAANDLAHSEAAVRITLTRGPGPRGLLPPDEPAPTLMIAAAPWAPPPREPARAILASTRRNEHSPLSRLKTLNYLDNVLARMQAAEQGADEALLCNGAGRLACASAANVFVVRGRSLLTPPLSEGVLPGITRAQVLALAPQLELTAIEVPLEPDQLAGADEAFLTNSLIGVRALATLDGRPIGDGAAGPVTRQIEEALKKRFGSSAASASV